MVPNVLLAILFMLLLEFTLLCIFTESFSAALDSQSIVQNFGFSSTLLYSR
jgi:hypothetical protein